MVLDLFNRRGDSVRLLVENIKTHSSSPNIERSDISHRSRATARLLSFERLGGESGETEEEYRHDERVKNESTARDGSTCRRKIREQQTTCYGRLSRGASSE